MDVFWKKNVFIPDKLKQLVTKEVFQLFSALGHLTAPKSNGFKQQWAINLSALLPQKAQVGPIAMQPVMLLWFVTEEGIASSFFTFDLHFSKLHNGKSYSKSNITYKTPNDLKNKFIQPTPPLVVAFFSPQHFNINLKPSHIMNFWHFCTSFRVWEWSAPPYPHPISYNYRSISNNKNPTLKILIESTRSPWLEEQLC